MDEERSKILNKMLEKIAQENQYFKSKISIKSASSGGANYTSYLHQVTISAPGKDDLKLFVKLAALGEKIRFSTELILYETENFFYNKLLKNYEAIEERNLVPSEHRLVTPKFYASNEECCKEVLILEDMTSKGYQIFDRFESIDWKYASKSVQNLAKLHALSIAWSLDDPESFKNTANLDSNTYISITLELLKNVITSAIEVTRLENKKKIEKFYKEVTKNDVFRDFFKPIRRPVIAHGDYRSSNLLHRKLVMMPFGLLISTYLLLLITVQEEDAPKVDKDIEINDFLVTPNNLYKERLNDIIDDYIDMGVF